MSAYKTKDKSEKVYLVTKDNKSWYVLSKDKFYDQPAIIDDGALMEISGQYQFMICFVDLTHEKQPVVKSFAEEVGGQ